MTNQPYLDTLLKSYFKQIFETALQGDAREESFYFALEALLRGYADAVGKSHIHITALPKKTDAGNPDFRLWDGSHKVIGYIEAKAPTVEHLDAIETSAQLKRYLQTFANLILTNFFEFRLYRNGTLIDKVVVSRPYHIYKLNSMPVIEDEGGLHALLQRFFAFSLPMVTDAQSLAVELAKRTRFLKTEVVSLQLAEEVQRGRGSVLNFYKAFKDYLLSGLTQDEFADLYSQTITFGLFSARTKVESGFNRKLAYDKISKTIGILRDIFQYISLGDLPLQMQWIIDDISEVLAVTDVYKLLDEYYHKHMGKDPIVHFYETFLAQYDPETRQRRGVYYTPLPVVTYIVRSLHEILKTHFALSDGFANQSVTVLDPAGGTLTFIAEATELAVNEFTSRYGDAKKRDFIKEHILKNFYAFEIMMAPYVIGHIKMSFLLEELGYRLQEDDRFKLYLTNTLEINGLLQSELPGIASLSEEAQLANEIKRDEPILVILGNPPYSVSSVNKSEFIEQAMELYKKGITDERNIQPLSDDYIKFIRFAQWKIDKAGKGLIGMITNNSYLSGLIHRTMRKSLLESFSEIYILNLHGSSRIAERCPDGSKDENVFDIQQGVAIAIFVKAPNQTNSAKVFYQDVYGLREAKQDYLNNHTIKSTKWIRLKPAEPYYFFVPKDFSNQTRYDRFHSIKDIFIQSSSCVKTHRDHLIVGFSRQEVKQKMAILTSDLSDELVRQSLNLKDTRDWDLKTARQRLKELDFKDYIRPYAYRPFDIRQICYLPVLIDRGCDRWAMMRNFFDLNIGLISVRQIVSNAYNHAFVTCNVADMGLANSPSYIFPLYVYQKKKDTLSKTTKHPKRLFDTPLKDEVKEPNIHSEFIESLAQTYKKPVSAEDVFYYIYAVLYSEGYRTTYAEFLKIDFPRVPFTKDYRLFKKMVAHGKALVELHLLTSPELDRPMVKFHNEGSDEVTKLRYEKGKLFINDTQYFEKIPEELWQYQIGGYQVLQKWLKDRQGKTLTLEDVKHYCKIATAIKKTIELQLKVDSIFTEIENAEVV